MASKMDVTVRDLWEAAERIAEFMAANPADHYQVTCQPRLRLRTLQMLRYYFGVIVRGVCQFHNDTQNVGWSVDDAHRYLKVKYMIDFVDAAEAIGLLMLGEVDLLECVFRIYRTLEECTTTDKDIGKFKDIMERIRKDYDKKGCVLPLPNEIPITAYENELC